MVFIENNLLTLILFTPTLAALLVLGLPNDRPKLIRWVSLLLSLVPTGLAIYLWVAYDPQIAGYQFEVQAAWYPQIKSSFHLGVDGISVPMVLLTGILTPLAMLASWNIKDRVKSFMVLFLLLEMGMMGVFLSLDLLLFFVFWEIGLVPMYFLINQWGSANRNYASLKFIIYTMAGSLGLLLAIQLLGVTAGSFDLVTITEKWVLLSEPLTVLGLPITLPIESVKTIAFWAFVVAFAIKVPVWPFHTWLPDAHTEAPTGGSMILAGVLLKLGAYGFLRLILPLYPQQAAAGAGVLALLAVLAIVLGAFAAWGQNDFKRLVAYSSVNHMGFVILGIAAAAYANADQSLDAVMALNGVVLQMFNHGLSAAAMFFLVGVIYERTHTRQLDEFGGLFPLAPVYGGILIFTSMASLGLPGLNGFVSEFMIVRGSWPIFSAYTAVAMIGLFFTGAYILKGIMKVLHGPLNQAWKDHALEIRTRELVTIVPLMVLMLVIGIWPAWIVRVINETIMRLFG